MHNQENKALEIYSGKSENADIRQRRYRNMGIMLFILACSLLVVRIFVTLLSEVVTSDTTLNVIFSLTLQIGALVIFPVLFYTFKFKMKPKEILEFSNFRRTKWYNYVLAFALGLGIMFAAMGISIVWQSIIRLFGYTHTPDSSDLPEKFNFGLLLLNLFLTAMLPGFCEEFAMRGGYLTTMRKSFRVLPTIIIMGISFGLFHQYITQVFYTMCFGLLMAALTLKTKSIFPAMIVHFMNNGISVYLEFAEKYGFFGGNFYEQLDLMLINNPPMLFLAYIVIFACCAGIVALIFYLNSTNRLRKKKELITSSGFDVTNGKVVLIGEENKELVKELDMDKEVYGEKIEEDLFVPTLRDNVFYFGAAVIAAVTTIFTFIWGFMI